MRRWICNYRSIQQLNYPQIHLSFNNNKISKGWIHKASFDNHHTFLLKDNSSLVIYSKKEGTFHNSNYIRMMSQQSYVLSESQPGSESKKKYQLQRRLNSQREKWKKRYDELCQFKQIHGHTNVPQNEGILGQWVKNQRQGELGKWVKKNNLLFPSKSSPIQPQYDNSDKESYLLERYNLLESIGFVWNTKAIVWEERYQQLLDFKQEHGHIHLSPIVAFDSSSPYQNLVKWSNRQREYYKLKKLQTGKRNGTTAEQALTDENIARLNEIGFLWSTNDRSGEAWMKHYKKLKRFKKIIGHCNISSQQDPKLYDWMKEQRHQYKKKISGEKSSMTDERENALSAINFEWDPVEIQWMHMFEELKAYKERFGDCLVPQQYSQNPRLGHWVNMQRRIYTKLEKRGKIPDNYDHEYSAITPTFERFKMLNDLGFVWRIVSRISWEERFQQLMTFYEIHGHCNLKLSADFQNKGLLIWFKRQINKYWSMVEYQNDPDIDSPENESFSKRNLLTSQQISKLESLGIDWNMLNRIEFENGLSELKTYKELYGDTLVPTELPQMPNLPQWVSNVRRHYEWSIKGKKTPLLVDQINKLTQLGFVWTVEEAQWWHIHKKFQKNEARGMTKDMQRKLSKLMMQQQDWGELGSKVVSQYRDGNDQTNKTEQESVLMDIDDDSDWNKMFKSLKQFVAETGSTLVPRVYPKNSELATWVTMQREHYAVRKNRNSESSSFKELSKERIQALDDIGFIWKIQESEWEKFYIELLNFREEYGHCEVPLWFSANPRLGNWLFAQQRQHSLYVKGESSSLTKLQIKLLEDAGVSWHHQ